MHFDAIDAERPIVGMVHLAALPGAPAYEGEFGAVLDAAVRDARRLESGGVDALLVENFGDAPFHPEDVPKHVVASMTRVATELRDAVDLPLGINVLRNDAEAALSVASAADAGFVRVNVHVGARVTDQGIVEGRAHETMRLREALESDVAVLADVDVKHSAPLAGRAPDEPAGEELAEAIERGLADGLVVSGAGTGHAVSGERLSTVVSARDERGLDAPVFVGSGVTVETVADALDVADGAIVGTALKEGGETTAPVDEERVRKLVAAADEVR